MVARGTRVRETIDIVIVSDGEGVYLSFAGGSRRRISPGGSAACGTDARRSSSSSSPTVTVTCGNEKALVNFFFY